MISDILKEKITPNLKERLLDKDYKFMDEALSECYRLKEGSEYVIAIKPINNSWGLTMEFLETTGEFYDIESWDYAKENGELL